MTYRNVCFSCHSYIGDQIHAALEEAKTILDNGETVTQIFSVDELGNATSYIGKWLDKNGITKLCCRDNIRDNANMNKFDLETNLNEL